eukprot:1373434-Rhodomonas_salina.1
MLDTAQRTREIMGVRLPSPSVPLPSPLPSPSLSGPRQPRGQGRTAESGSQGREAPLSHSPPTHSDQET